MMSYSRWIAAGLFLVCLLGCIPAVEQSPMNGQSGSAASQDGAAGRDGGADHDDGTDASANKPDPPFASAEIVADRLARMIWDTSADPSVTGMLSAGVSRLSVGQAASQMLADARARAGVAAFYRWWLFFGTAKPGDEVCAWGVTTS